jgi:hypothetical protein
MIQILEFTAYMQLYNINFDPTLEKILGEIAEATTISLLDIHTGSMY